MHLIFFKNIQKIIFFIVLYLVLQGMYSAQATPIRVGIYDNKPLVFTNAQKEPEGLFVDVLQASAQTTDWDIQYVVGTWSSLLEQLKSGDIDLLPCIAPTPERLSLYDFSDEPILLNWGQVYVSTQPPFNSLLELKNKTIGFLEDDLHKSAFNNIAKSFNITYISREFSSYHELLEALRRGDIAAAVMGRLYGSTHTLPSDIYPSPIIFHPIQLFFAVTKNDPKHILPVLNKQVDELKKDTQSRYYRALNTIFDQPATQNIIPSWLKTLSIGLVLLVIGIGCVAILFRRQIHLKTAELEHQRDQLELEIREREAIQSELERHAEHLETLLHLSQIESDKDNEIGQFALDQAIRLTGSEFGFIGEIDEGNPDKLIPLVFSKNVMVGCNTDFQQTFTITNAGWWGDAIRTGQATLVNDYAHPSPSKKGLPEGHVPLSRFLCVPVIRNGIIVALIGVANKKTDYTQTDAAQLNLLGQAMMMHKLRHLDQCTISDHESRYKALVHSVGEGIVLLDANGFIQTWNKVAEQLFHISADDIVGQPLRILAPLIHEYDSQGPQSIGLFEVIEERRALRDAIFCIHIANTPDTWIKCTVTPMNGDSPTPLSTVLSFSDMTEQERIKKELILAKDAAESANTAKSQFLANMSHELRTPLNGAMGMLQLLRMTGLDTEQEELSEVALRSCNNLTRLLEDLLDLSKIESGRLELAEEPFSIRDIIAILYETYEDEAKRKGISITFDVAENVPETAKGDPIRIRQILFNLVGNAVKFTASGSVQISIFTHIHNDIIKLVSIISDTGVGISDDILDSIFTPFTQADNSFTRKFQGAGLGLPIVKRLVQFMDASVCIDTEPNRGTTIGVSLPLHCDIERLPVSTTVVHLPDASAKDTAPILLVEDDSVNQLCVQRMLQVAGYDTVCANNGAEALNLLKLQQFQLVLMDIQMPVMGGLEAVHELRTKANYERNVEVPVIALTAYAMQGDREQFLEAGINHYLPKPIDMDELLDTVKEYLDTSVNYHQSQ